MSPLGSRGAAPHRKRAPCPTRAPPRRPAHSRQKESRMPPRTSDDRNDDRPVLQTSGYKNGEPTRICPHCGKEKPLSEFGYRRMEDGEVRNQSWCKDCR